MKKKLNYLFKSIVLLVFIAFTGCEVQEDISKKSSERELKKSFVSLKDLKTNKNLISKIQEIKSKKSSSVSGKLVYNSDYDFYIDDEKILLIEDGDKQWFTFSIFRNQDSEKIENLVLKLDENGNYSTFITKYELSDAEIQNVNNNIAIENINNKIEIVPLDTSRTSQVIYLIGENCYVIDSISDDGGGVATVYFIQVDCPESGTSSSGGGGSSSGGSSGGSGYIPNYGSGTGSGSNSGYNNDNHYPGGGSSSGSNNNTLVTQPVTSLEQQQIKTFMLSLTPEQRDFLNGDSDSDPSNDNPVIEPIFDYLSYNDYTSESQEFVKDVIDALNDPEPIFDNSDFPGKDDGLPFEWWKDENYIINNLKIVPDDSTDGVAEVPNVLELALYMQYPAQALIHIENSLDAKALSQTSGLPNLHNGKADAYRHAYWNARDTADIGKNITALFTTAHEYNSGNHLLETQMDFFNNSQGRDIGENYNFFTSDAVIQTQVMNAITFGTLQYLTPLGQNPIYPSVFDVILSTTQIKWTNQ